MSDGQFKTPTPLNEEVCSYTPHLKETQELKEELERQKARVLDIPLVIGGKRRETSDLQDVTCPHDKQHKLARVAQGRSEDVDIVLDRLRKQGS